MWVNVLLFPFLLCCRVMSTPLNCPCACPCVSRRVLCTPPLSLCLFEFSCDNIYPYNGAPEDAQLLAACYIIVTTLLPLMHSLCLLYCLHFLSTFLFFSPPLFLSSSFFFPPPTSQWRLFGQSSISNITFDAIEKSKVQKLLATSPNDCLLWLRFTLSLPLASLSLYHRLLSLSLYRARLASQYLMTCNCHSYRAKSAMTIVTIIPLAPLHWSHVWTARKATW